MGDAAGERAIKEVATKWNYMLDVLSGYHAGNESAETLADAVTSYTVAIQAVKITIPEGHNARRAP